MAPQHIVPRVAKYSAIAADIAAFLGKMRSLKIHRFINKVLTALFSNTLTIAINLQDTPIPLKSRNTYVKKKSTTLLLNFTRNFTPFYGDSAEYLLICHEITQAPGGACCAAAAAASAAALSWRRRFSSWTSCSRYLSCGTGDTWKCTKKILKWLCKT